MKPGGNLSQQKNKVLWEFSESESWSIHEDEVTGKTVAYKKTRESLRLPVFFLQKIRESYS